MELSELERDVLRVLKIYRRRKRVTMDGDWMALKMGEEVGELIRAYLRMRDRPAEMRRRSIELADEAADVLCVLLAFCAVHGVDIEGAIERKWLCHLRRTPSRSSRPTR
jgi:NTP pyrophosphatase (non-canonical NTP hydrolase)